MLSSVTNPAFCTSFKKINGTKKSNSMNTAKLKVQIVLLYFLIITLYSVPNYTVSTITGITFSERLMTYFNCESQGIQPGRTCERMFDRSTSEILNAVSSVLFGLYPVVNLLFIINFHEMKKKILICLNGKSKRYATRTSTLTTFESRLSTYSYGGSCDDLIK